MFLPEDKVKQQWRTYLPFLYKFYFQHTEKSFVDIVAAKWYKGLGSKQSLSLNFIIAGLSKVEHYNQQYTYTLEEYLIKSFELILPEQSIQPQCSQINRQNQRSLPSVVEKRKIFYERQITCLQDIILFDKSSNQQLNQSYFYAAAIKNDSIRLISAAKLAGLNQKHSFLSENSPFSIKNIRQSTLCQGNQMEIGIIPLQKQVTVIKFDQKQMNLLCGCQDGSIVMINLNSQLSLNHQIPPNTFIYFSYHKSPIKDMIFLTYPSDQNLLFASIASDGTFYFWKKDNPNLPVLLVEQGSTQPSSLIQVHPDQFIQCGRDCVLKFFDIKRGYSYLYNQNNEIINKLYNLTGLIEYQKNKKQTHMDNTLRFVSCAQSGKITFWQGQKQFQHLTHTGKIASLDFITKNDGLFLAIEKQKAKLSIFSPILFTYCLKDVAE